MLQRVEMGSLFFVYCVIFKRRVSGILLFINQTRMNYFGYFVFIITMKNSLEKHSHLMMMLCAAHGVKLVSQISIVLLVIVTYAVRQNSTQLH